MTDDIQRKAEELAENIGMGICFEVGSFDIVRAADLIAAALREVACVKEPKAMKSAEKWSDEINKHIDQNITPDCVLCNNEGLEIIIRAIQNDAIASVKP